MSRHQPRFWVVSFLFAAINVAGIVWIRQSLVGNGTPRLRVLSALPVRDVDKTDRLSLVFDEPIVDADAVGKPLDKSPFAIQPMPDGRWQWSQPNTLAFVLAKPLPAGRVYKIKPAVDLETQTRRVLIGDGTFEFRTRALEVESCYVASADREHANIEIEFNQRVAPADLLAQLVIKRVNSGERAAAVCLTREPSEKLLVRVEHERSMGLLVGIDKALKGHGGELPLESSYNIKVQISDTFVHLSTDVNEPRLEDEIVVRLNFSQAIDPKQKLAPPAVQPAVSDLRTRISDNTLVLVGKFQPGVQYSLTIPDSLLSKSGKKLEQAERVTLNVPEREPTVSFPLSRGILSPEGNLLLDLSTVNTSGLEIEARRVFANNIVPHVRGDGEAETSDEVASKKIKCDAPRNVVRKAALDLKSLLGKATGVYHLSARATDHAWTRDDAIVTISDLAITSKATRDGLFIWVTSLRTGKPVEGADVTALTYNNQTLGSVKTAADGTAIIPVARNGDRSPWLITAALGDDLNYLRPDLRQWVIDDIDGGGRSVPENYDVFLYTERGIYRPGDTIHLTGLIREIDGATPPPFPIDITLIRPDGKRLPAQSVTPIANQDGFVQIDLPTREDGRTGRYRIEATLPGSSEVIGSTSTLVEAFVPARIEMTASANAERFSPGHEATGKVSGKYLFGPPAAGLPWSLNVTYVPARFKSADFPDFTFGDGVSRPTYSPPEVEGETDENGLAQLTLPQPRDASAGRWRADCSVTLTEPGGRSLSRNFSTLVDMTDRFLGLRLARGAIAPVGESFPIEYVQCDAEGKLTQSVPLEVTLVRVEYDNVLQRVNGQAVWKSTERLIPVEERTVTGKRPIDKPGTFSLTCPESGYYRLTAVDTRSKLETVLAFHASEDGGTATTALNRPEHLDIVLDSPRYAPGGKAVALIRSPFAGTALVTLETDRIVQTQVVDIAAGSDKVEIDLPAGIRGGAFVSASVVRAVDPAAEDWLPHRAMGLARLHTDHADKALPLALTIAPSCRPGDAIEARIEAKTLDEASAPGVVHLWAVDEGILLTTDYRKPDPLAHFFAPRSMTIDSSDVFADLLPDTARPASMERIGADGDDDSDAMRGNPVPSRQRAAAVIWRSVEPIGSDGILNLKLDIPQMTGALRVMAVVAQGDRYGTAASTVTVAAPLMCEATWPRVVAPGDSFATPVKLFNSTDQPLTAELTVDVSGPLTIDASETTGKAEIPANGSSTVWLRSKAGGMGPVHLRILASATHPELGTLTAEAEADFSSRPAAPLHTESTFVTIKAGEKLDLAAPDGYLPGSVQRTAAISANPTVDLRPAVEQVIDYPYGCVEQTTSGLICMLYAADLIATDSPGTERAGAIARMMDAGIARLWSMQTRDGGLGYWPGAMQSDVWGTSYAAQFLATASRSGYHVEQGFKDELARYLDRLLSNSNHDDLSDNMRAGLCHALAVFEKPAMGWMDQLTQSPARLDMSGRASLAAAWIAVGRKDRAAALLQDDTLGQSIATTTSGRFVSQTQSEAALLSTLLDLDPRHPWIAPLVQRLNGRREKGRWGTTLENAAAISALCKYQLVVDEPADFEGTLSAGADRYSFNSKGTSQFTLADPSQAALFETSGTGDVHVCITTTGRLLDESVKPYERQLTLTREWLDREGKPIDSAQLHVGDLIHVRVTIAAPALTDGNTVDNVAIVNVLPGGTEVENPRLATSAHAGGDVDVRPDRTEFLDDRVILFTSVGQEKRQFDYYIRATTAGEFAAPPIEASCMYDPGFAALTGGGRVEISK